MDYDKFITNCNSHYKLRRLLQTVTDQDSSTFSHSVISGANINLFLQKYSSSYSFLFFSITLNSFKAICSIFFDGSTFNASNLSEKTASLLVPSTTFLKYSLLLSMNFSKATFGESCSSSFSVLSTESLKSNISFGNNGVNLSKRRSFLFLIRYFNKENVYLFQSLLKFHLLILFELVLPLVLCHYR